jgi:hypothetical protein
MKSIFFFILIISIVASCKIKPIEPDLEPSVVSFDCQVNFNTIKTSYRTFSTHQGSASTDPMSGKYAMNSIFFENVSYAGVLTLNFNSKPNIGEFMIVADSLLLKNDQVSVIFQGPFSFINTLKAEMGKVIVKIDGGCYFIQFCEISAKNEYDNTTETLSANCAIPFFD